MPDENSPDFATTRAITTYKSNSIEGLAQALAESVEPGDVEVVDNLVIFASDIGRAQSDNPRRIVRIGIGSEGFVSCHISGDPGWVNSQTAVLRPLLQEARPRKWGIWFAPRLAWVGWGASLALLLTTFFNSLSLSILGAVAGVACGFAVGGILRRILKVEICLTRNELPSSYWRFTANEVVTAVIALAAIAVAVIFGVIAHKDSQKESSDKALSLAHSSWN
ncbi:hypothetical protein [Streptomyces sp. NPDC006333]|uniref:hypothetical protein n=1 Tax=Streptomyces sp. NPDC006333 TaxID=3156753 RepID=UPI0033B762DB